MAEEYANHTHCTCIHLPPANNRLADWHQFWLSTNTPTIWRHRHTFLEALWGKRRLIFKDPENLIKQFKSTFSILHCLMTQLCMTHDMLTHVAFMFIEIVGTVGILMAWWALHQHKPREKAVIWSSAVQMDGQKCIYYCPCKCCVRTGELKFRILAFQISWHCAGCQHVMLQV